MSSASSSLGKVKSDKTTEQAQEPPKVTLWEPDLAHDGSLTGGSVGEISVIDEKGKTQVIPFSLDSFAIWKLAYYVCPGDLVTYADDGVMIEANSLRLRTLGLLQTWEYDGGTGIGTGTVLCCGKAVPISETQIAPDDLAALAPDKVVRFEVGQGGAIRHVRIATPTIAELPEDRRVRIKATFDRINEGGLAKLACVEIPTWICVKCDNLNFDKLQSRAKAGAGENQEVFQRTCMNPQCGAVRPPRACCMGEVTNDSGTTRYTLKAQAPRFWTLSEVAQWKKDGGDGHTTFEQVVAKALERYDSREVMNVCPGCEGKVGTSSGCCAQFDPKTYPYQDFLQFYELDATPKGKSRRKQMEDVLNSFPPCICGLSAIPKAPLNVFRLVKGTKSADAARKHYESHRDKIFQDILLERLLSEEATLYPSVSQGSGDQAMLCHIVPIQANGCKSSPKNIFWRLEICPLCQNLDMLFTKWQGE